MPFKDALTKARYLKKYWQGEEERLSGIIPKENRDYPLENEDLDTLEFLKELRAELVNLADWARDKLRDEKD